MRRIALLAMVAVTLAACSSGAAKRAPFSKPSDNHAPAASRSSAASAPAPTAGPAATVPSKYRPLYVSLTKSLDAYQAAVDAMPSSTGASPGPTPAAELLPANGNRLKALLAPATLHTVDAWLDRFTSMGIKGVTIGIKLPMLLPRFGPDSEAYTSFYATVAEHARSRGLRVDVELGALFCGTTYASCSKPFDGTYTQFVSDSIAQARIVLRRVKPDLLNLLAEPTTQASLAGVREFATPAGAGQYVRDVLAGIGDRGSTKVGAGAACWLAPEFLRAIAAESVDFLVVHIYPVNAAIAATLVADAKVAAQAGKPIVADEVGLYKTDHVATSTAATADSVYRLDSFSFFQPLDIRFLAITTQWAGKAGVSYVAPFWAGQFFAYLAWTPALDALPNASLTRTANAAIAQAFLGGKLTSYGQTWPPR